VYRLSTVADGTDDLVVGGNNAVILNIVFCWLRLDQTITTLPSRWRDV
jgi:hypothetical protein